VTVVKSRRVTTAALTNETNSRPVGFPRRGAIEQSVGCAWNQPRDRRADRKSRESFPDTFSTIHHEQFRGLERHRLFRVEL
jgi:hypothetical protein